MLQELKIHTQAILPVIGTLLAGFLLPIGILITRDNVKMRRQEIIRELEKFFLHETNVGSSIIPSFEFVKTKYYVQDENSLSDREIPIRWYSIPVLIFSGLSAICLFTATVLVVPNSSSPNPLPFNDLLLLDYIPKSLFLTGGENYDQTEFIKVLTVAIFAFFGAYLAAIKNMVRSVANFDLSPITFFRGSYAIIASMVVAVALWRSLPLSLTNALQNTNISAAVLGFAAAFVIGFVPGLPERYILSMWRRGNVKRMDNRALERTKSIPLEPIDGIDADIRSRLEDFNLFDVQNLATANPIMLFVETPFGIYQSIDWVAQAQLATAVGLEKYLKLRELSLRTIFDLERVFFAGGESESSALQARVANIILPPAEAHRAAGTEIKSDVQEAVALASLIIDDLAVVRLRQIWMTVERNLRDYLRFPPMPRKPLAAAE